MFGISYTNFCLIIEVDCISYFLLDKLEFLQKYCVRQIVSISIYICPYCSFKVIQY